MKRYRVISLDFDARVHSLNREIRAEWEESVKEQHRQSRRATQESLIHAFGAKGYHAKRQNFIDLDAKPLSVLAFHNRFFEQARIAFITGAYYPALAGTCALGERILNHLVLTLRDDFKASPEYKRIYSKDSFDNWDTAIDALASWGVLLPEVADEFRTLKDMRNKSLHFRPEVDTNDRELALEAIKSLSSIIGTQFSAFGPQPWFIKSIPGEIYIRKASETDPFIKHVYLPNSLHVGYKHKVESVLPQFVVNDQFDYEDREITDEEFSDLRKAKA
ncbi:MAG: hypothetical protein H6822_33855 [Planctomycetaceae bacterium]|nr:hypothetical protein [Planctomycetales bacterium]MCB9927173.1 hypothetical protein [Planctomycetaceae bacterium]